MLFFSTKTRQDSVARASETQPWPNLKLSQPSDEVSLAKFLAQSRTLMDGDLLVIRDGVRIVSPSEVEVPPPIQPSDNQLNLADIDTIKVFGKGSGGIVKLMQDR